ncbi:hypothetical protein Plhal304r1_c007g0029811 [Plasmopara halstedii]
MACSLCNGYMFVVQASRGNHDHRIGSRGWAASISSGLDVAHADSTNLNVLTNIIGLILQQRAIIQIYRW